MNNMEIKFSFFCSLLLVLFLSVACAPQQEKTLVGEAVGRAVKTLTCEPSQYPDNDPVPQDIAVGESFAFKRSSFTYVRSDQVKEGGVAKKFATLKGVSPARFPFKLPLSNCDLTENCKGVKFQLKMDVKESGKIESYVFTFTNATQEYPFTKNWKARKYNCVKTRKLV